MAFAGTSVKTSTQILITAAVAGIGVNLSNMIAILIYVVHSERLATTLVHGPDSAATTPVSEHPISRNELKERIK
jgi:hypothetical protein